VVTKLKFGCFNWGNIGLIGKHILLQLRVMGADFRHFADSNRNHLGHG